MLSQTEIAELGRALSAMNGTGRNHVPVHVDLLRRMLDGESRMVTKWLQYVRHADVESYLAAGWTLEHGLDGTHHSAYSVLLIWEGEGDPPKPAHEVRESAE